MKISDHVPGHVYAYTLWLTLLMGVITVLWAHSLIAVLGVPLFAVGTFSADQATHLGQVAHASRPPTAIERALQDYRWPSFFGGLVCAGTGLVIMLHYA